MDPVLLRVDVSYAKLGGDMRNLIYLLDTFCAAASVALVIVTLYEPQYVRQMERLDSGKSPPTACVVT